MSAPWVFVFDSSILLYTWSKAIISPMVSVNIFFEKRSTTQHSTISRKCTRIECRETTDGSSFSVRHHCPTQTHNELRSDIRTLIRFFSLVHGEKKFCNDSPMTGKDRNGRGIMLEIIRVEVAGSIPNGMNTDVSDAASAHGTARSGPPSGWVNALAAGGGATAGIGGQSTLSRKSGKEKTLTDHRRRIWVMSEQSLLSQILSPYRHLRWLRVRWLIDVFFSDSQSSTAYIIFTK